MRFFFNIVQSTIFVGLLSLLLLIGCDQKNLSSDVVVHQIDQKNNSLSIQIDRMEITNAWVRALPGKNTAAYFQVNNDSVARRIVSVSSDAAAEVQMHESTSQDGLMSMRKLSDLDLPASKKIVFEPNGKHLMLIGLKQKLKLGEKIAIKLTFDSGHEMSFDAEVKSDSSDKDARGHDHH